MTVDARAMAAECARAVEACESPTRRAVLGTLQKLWIELGEKEGLLSEQEVLKTVGRPPNTPCAAPGTAKWRPTCTACHRSGRSP